MRLMIARSFCVALAVGALMLASPPSLAQSDARPALSEADPLRAVAIANGIRGCLASGGPQSTEKLIACACAVGASNFTMSDDDIKAEKFDQKAGRAITATCATAAIKINKDK